MPRNPLRQFLRIDELGQVPSGQEFNESIRPSVEHAREAALLANMDQRAEVGLRNDLAEAEAVRGARNMGFEGSFPLREQADYETSQKLRQILLPKQMEVEAAQINRATDRDFRAEENEKQRQLQRELMGQRQTAQTARTTMQQEGMDRRAAQDPRRRPSALDRLLGFFRGGDEAAPAPVTGPSADSVLMMDPASGETRQVPAHLVETYRARGAQIVN